nr:reverse transcriptase domain-containing protein [Tanacetum cinerariifolium]
MRSCMAGSETLEILAHCHLGPTGGHHSASVTAKKVYKFGFYWPSVFKDANEYVRRCDACQRLGNISLRNEMPYNNIQRFLGGDFGSGEYIDNVIDGPIVLDYRNLGVSETNLAGIKACNYETRAGCKVIGSSFVGDYYEDYFCQSGSVWSIGKPSLCPLFRTQRDAFVVSPIDTNIGYTNVLCGGSNHQTDIGETFLLPLFGTQREGMSSSSFGQKQKVCGVCKRRKRKRARSLKVVDDGVEADNIMLETVYHGGVTDSYIDIGDFHWVYEHCSATFWYCVTDLYIDIGDFHWVYEHCSATF